MAYVPINPGDFGDAGPVVGNFKHGYWGQAVYDVDTGPNDAYIINLDPAPPALLAGMVFRFKVTTGNGGSATLQVGLLAAKTIKKRITVNLETGDIIPGMVVTVKFDGTNFQLEGTSLVDNAKAKVSIDDTALGYYEDKIVGASGKVSVVTLNPGANEQLEIDLGGDVFDKVIDDSDDINEGVVNRFLQDASVSETEIKDSIIASWDATAPEALPDYFEIGENTFITRIVVNTNPSVALVIIPRITTGGVVQLKLDSEAGGGNWQGDIDVYGYDAT